MRKKKRWKEKYSIIIASETDARKESKTFSLTRRALILMISIIFLVIFACVGGTVFSVMQTGRYSEQIEVLKRQIDDKSGLVASYSTEGYSPEPSPEITGGLQSEPAETPVPQLTAAQQPEVSPQPAQTQQPESTAQPAQTQQPEASQQPTQQPKASQQPAQSPEASASPVINVNVTSAFPSPAASSGASTMNPSLSAVNGQNTGNASASGAIDMKDAVAQISADFQSAIDKRIDDIKEKETYDNVKVLYDGDLDGDSDTVNNWADVLSVFMVETMNSGQKLLTITPKNEKTLSDIYYEMNNLSIDSEKMITTVNDPVKGEVSSTTLVIHVTVNSLTYMEDMSLHKFTSSQKSKLKKLMSPSYYTYFESLLGIDVYGGVPSKEVENVVAKLPKGSKGSEIVKAALIRLGAPYSKSKRGSGNYVDCSYMTWWAYNQAGISIPTSSVEQALYCYNKKCTVKISELAPGDLIFWTKTDADDGRWREIHHVGIYIGGGMIIDASSNKGRVVIRKLWSGTEWKIAFAARPYALQKNAGS